MSTQTPMDATDDDAVSSQRCVCRHLVLHVCACEGCEATSILHYLQAAYSGPSSSITHNPSTTDEAVHPQTSVTSPHAVGGVGGGGRKCEHGRVRSRCKECGVAASASMGGYAAVAASASMGGSAMCAKSAAVAASASMGGAQCVQGVRR